MVRVAGTFAGGGSTFSLRDDMASLIAICICLSFGLALVLVPSVRWLARRIGMVDRPDQQRKLQSEAIALGGGVAVFLSVTMTFAAALLIDRAFFGDVLGSVTSKWYVLFGSAGAMLLVGLFDDAYGLRGRQKLLCQCLIIACLIGGGTLIQKLSIFNLEFELGLFSVPVTVLWLLIAVNALNLIDGADGMATTAGLVICVGLGLSSLHSSSQLSIMTGFALAGALVGFLIFNKPPASIYLGDAGSMMIGLFVGVLAIWSTFKESTVLSAAPIAILAIPLFDSTAAVLRRWLTGRSLYATDRAHLHHMLQQKYGNKNMLWVVAGLCSVTMIFSVASLHLRQPWLAPFGLLIVLAILIKTRSFGNAEASLVISRTFHFFQSLAMARSDVYIKKHQRRVPLQGDADWDTVWEPLVDFAKKHELARVKIDLNLAWIHEAYHANWQSVRLPEKAFQLVVSLPLFASRQWRDESPIQIGRLEIIALAEDGLAYQKIAELGDQLSDLSPEIDRIVRALEVARMPRPTVEAPSKAVSAGAKPAVPAINDSIGSALNA